MSSVQCGGSATWPVSTPIKNRGREGGRLHYSALVSQHSQNVQLSDSAASENDCSCCFAGRHASTIACQQSAMVHDPRMKQCRVARVGRQAHTEFAHMSACKNSGRMPEGCCQSQPRFLAMRCAADSLASCASNCLPVMFSYR